MLYRQAKQRRAVRSDQLYVEMVPEIRSLLCVSSRRFNRRVCACGENDVLSNSRWFTRGWTLQELIAPLTVEFLGQDWSLIGVKAPSAVLALLPPLQRERNDMFLLHIAKITGTAENMIRYIQKPRSLRKVPIAQKMAWAARRQTAREEDLAYSLMGLFDVNMPILYGEGLKKAFRRLQLDIIQMNCVDQSIFLWRRTVKPVGS